MSAFSNGEELAPPVARFLDPLGIRKRLGRDDWGAPKEFGPDGWSFDNYDGRSRIIVTCSDLPDDLRLHVHASISHAGWMPDYDDLVKLHEAVWNGKGYAYQVFAPPEAHVNIHPTALHLWGLLDGTRLLPNFGYAGSI